MTMTWAAMSTKMMEIIEAMMIAMIMSRMETRATISEVNTKKMVLIHEDRGIKEPCDGSYDDDEDYEGSHTTHHEDEDDLRYNSSSHLLYESYDEDSHENGSYDKNNHEVSRYSYALSCGASYPSRGGMCGYVGIRQSRPMEGESAFPTSRNTRSHASNPNVNVSILKWT